MSGTPELNSPSDPPPASTVAEENKNVPTTTHHSPAPWALFPTSDDRPPSACFEVRAHNGTTVAWIAYDEEIGITPLELADAALIVNSPALLLALSSLFSGFLFLRGHVPFESESSVTVKNLIELARNTDKLLTHLRKAGVL